MFDRTRAVIKREFTEAVRTKTFVIGTLLAPVLMGGFIALPIVLSDDGGGERSIAIVDATGAGIGDAVAAILPASGAAVASIEGQRFYRTEVIPLGRAEPDSVRAALAARAADDELDGFLWLSSGLLDGGSAVYEGENATNFAEIAEIRGAVQAAVREHRLRASGIEPARVAAALRPVGFEARKTGESTATGSAEAAAAVAIFLGFAMYMAVILYGQAVMRGVLEEKRDRIVEIMASSIRTSQLMVGKVLGIGATGLLQLAIWAALAGIVLGQGDSIAAAFGVDMPQLPRVPLGVGIILLLYFLGGFFLYAVLFAIVGAVATSDQEAQQLAFPIMMPIIVGFVLMMSGTENPESTAMVVGSMIPFTSPIVMPTRASLVDVPALELLGSLALLAATAVACIWIAAKIYRIGMLATGKKPSIKDLIRWVRAA